MSYETKLYSLFKVINIVINGQAIISLLKNKIFNQNPLPSNTPCTTFLYYLQ